MNARVVLLAMMVAATLPVAASDQVRVVNERDIKELWGLAPGTHIAPLYPQAYAQDNSQVCLAVGYKLNMDGHASDFALLKAWNSKADPLPDERMWKAFAGSAAQALAQWRFVAKPGVASLKPVYTVATFVFGSGDATATGAHCAIPDLAAQLVALRNDAHAYRRMAGGFTRIDSDGDLVGQVEIMRQQNLARENQRLAMMAMQEQAQLRQQQMQQRNQQASPGTK